MPKVGRQIEVWRCPGATLYMGDSLCLLPNLDLSASILTDPPYGIDLDVTAGVGRQEFDKIIGDSEVFDPVPWLKFKDVILWGSNHYCHAIPPHEGQWYFWDKVIKNGLHVHIAEGEFCWHKLGTKPRAFRHLWSGAYRASEASDRSLHPSQKPVALMKWCLEQMGSPRLVIDPYMGSGTTGVACLEMGIEFIGIEIDPSHFKTARQRLGDYHGAGIIRDMRRQQTRASRASRRRSQ